MSRGISRVTLNTNLGADPQVRQMTIQVEYLAWIKPRQHSLQAKFAETQ